MSKYKVLAWGDSAIVGTGFGTVSRHVLKAIHDTGLYDIDHLAINFHGEFVEKSEIPWQMQAAKLLDPNDPHGIKMFKKTILSKDYDIVWILNDIYVTQLAASIVKEARDKYRAEGKKPPVFIYYYPIDCHCNPWAGDMLQAVDLAVCYTNHGRQETLKTFPHLSKKIREIPHGVDNNNFFRASPRECKNWKQKFWGLDADTKVVVNVNRNSTRKQIPYTILAFKEFKKIYPKSMLYLHMQRVDQAGDLAKALHHAGLTSKKDVMIPKDFSPGNSVPVKMLNQIYNAADMYLSTHLGEGWGLTITEAMAAGTPVVVPNNTCMPQQLGKNSERGYMYECKDLTMIDNSGYRPKGLIPDIVQQMVNVVEDGPKQLNPKAIKAIKFAKSHDWTNVGEQWTKLFSQAIYARDKSVVSLIEEV